MKNHSPTTATPYIKTNDAAAPTADHSGVGGPGANEKARPRTRPPRLNSSGMMYSRASVTAIPNSKVPNTAPASALSSDWK